MKYKKLTVVIGLLVIILFPGIRIMGAVGVKAGALMSKMDIGSDSTTGTWVMLGWRADAFFTLPLSKTASIQPGLSLAREGAKYYEVPGMDYEKVRMYFLKIPFIVVFHLPGDQVHMFFGPYIAYRLGEEKYTNPSWKAFSAEKRLGFGVSLGIRFYLPITFRGSLRSFVELNADLGMTEFKRTEPLPLDNYLPGVYYEEGAFYKSQNLSFLLGFTF